MKDVLVKSAKIVEKGNEWNGKVVDILIKDGLINEIGKSIAVKDVEEFEAPNLHVSQGWMDMQVNYCDPGLEHKEDIYSGIRASLCGGFTGALVMPATEPTISTKSSIEYLKRKSLEYPIFELIPAGALSSDLKGKEIAELFDMYSSGAKAFTDYKSTKVNTRLLSTALNYVKIFGGLVISFPLDNDLLEGRSIHEGAVAMELGLMGIPEIAEGIAINRDLFLAEYYDAPLHFSLISSSRGVGLIKESKKRKLKITAGVAAHQLCFTDEDLKDFDSHYKVLPPYRGMEDKKSLIKGLKNGILDVICSDHSPQNIENKKLEFDLAEYGISSAETMFSAALMGLEKEMALEDIIEKFSINPRRILGLEKVSILENSKANLTFFNPDKKWECIPEKLKSKSKNSPFINKVLKGKALAVYNNGYLNVLD